MLKRIFKVRFWLATAATLACTLASQAVVNGEATSEYEAVGQVFSIFESEPVYLGNCVLIGPNMVLTNGEVANVLKDLPQGNGRILVDGKARAVIEVHLHPDFEPSSLVNNLAILVFSRSIIDVEPALMYENTPFDGQSVTLVGHGSSQAEGNRKDATVGTRRSGTLTLDGVEAEEVAWTVDTTSEVTIGPGDAAAPLLVEEDGNLYIVGVVSRHLQDDFSTGDVVFATRIDAYLEWLQDPFPGPQTIVYRFTERYVQVAHGNREFVTRYGFLAIDRQTREMWALAYFRHEGRWVVTVESWHAPITNVAGRASAVDFYQQSMPQGIYSLMAQQYLSETEAQVRLMGGLADRLLYGSPVDNTPGGFTLLTQSGYSGGSIASGRISLRLDPVRTNQAAFSLPRNYIDNPDSDDDLAGFVLANLPNPIDLTLPENDEMPSEVNTAAIESSVAPASSHAFQFGVYVYIVRATERVVTNAKVEVSNGLGVLILQPNADDGGEQPRAAQGQGDRATVIMAFGGDRPGYRELSLNGLFDTEYGDLDVANYYQRLSVDDVGPLTTQIIHASETSDPYENFYLLATRSGEELPPVWTGQWNTIRPGEAGLMSINARFHRNYTVEAGTDFFGTVNFFRNLVSSLLGEERR